MADEQKTDEPQAEEGRAPRRGSVAYDGNNPVYLIEKYDDGTQLVGHFAHVERTSVGLTANAPKSDDE